VDLEESELVVGIGELKLIKGCGSIGCGREMLELAGINCVQR